MPPNDVKCQPSSEQTSRLRHDLLRSLVLLTSGFDQLDKLGVPTSYLRLEQTHQSPDFNTFRRNRSFNICEGWEVLFRAHPVALGTLSSTAGGGR